MNMVNGRRFDRAKIQYYPINTILFSMAGVLNFFVGKSANYVVAAIFLLCGGFWHLLYLLLKKNGYIVVEPTAITIFENPFRRNPSYPTTEIKSIEKVKNHYLIRLRNGRKKKIELFFIAKEQHTEFTQSMELLQQSID